MKTISGIIALGLAFSTPAQAGEEEDILAVVDQFFVGLKTADPSLWKPIMVPEGTVMVSREKDGAWTFSQRGIGADIDRLAENDAVIDEHYYNPTVLIRETLAVVWTPYDLYIDEELSHCGIDVFQMMKIDGEWKIAQVAYTIEPEGCEDLGVSPRE